MLTDRKGYIQRLVEQLARVLATMLTQRKQRNFDVAQQTLMDGCQSLLGIEYSVLTRFGAQSAMDLLRDGFRIRVLAELVLEDALLRHEQGLSEEALERLAFANDLIEQHGDKELKAKQQEIAALVVRA